MYQYSPLDHKAELKHCSLLSLIVGTGTSARSYAFAESGEIARERKPKHMNRRKHHPVLFSQPIA